MGPRCWIYAVFISGAVSGHGFDFEHTAVTHHSANATSVVRTAMILTGAVSRLYHSPSSKIGRPGSMYDSDLGPYTPLRVTGAGIQRHILQQNPNMDVFVHSWNPDLARAYQDAFKPLRAKFEDNRPMEKAFQNRTCSDWRQVSWAFSIQQGVRLLQQQEAMSGMRYDSVIFFRPDVMLLEDLNLSSTLKDTAKVYIDGKEEAVGDFHFIMTGENAHKFGGLYDSISERHCAKMHGWITSFILQEMGTFPVPMENVRPGHQEEVYRKIPFVPMGKSKAFCQVGMRYGFTSEDARDLGMKCEA